MPRDDWEKNSLYNIFTRMNLWPKEHIESVLDVACGLSLKSQFIPAKVRVGVDIFDEYLKKIETHVPYSVVRYDVRRLNDIFLPKSFDLVIACDIVEHLTKQEALNMIEDMERIAKVAVIIETPKGFIPQDLDIWGFGAHDLQTHKCGWDKEEFEMMGYSVLERRYTMSDVKRHTKIAVDPNITMLEAIKCVSS